MISMKVIGAKENKRFLKKKSNEIKAGAQEGLTKAALHVQNEVKLSIAGRKAEKRSVDTGRFMGSVDKEVGKFDAIVFSDLEYSKFLEFGTSRFRARRHFQNTKAREKKKIIQILQKEIDRKI